MQNKYITTLEVIDECNKDIFANDLSDWCYKHLSQKELTKYRKLKIIPVSSNGDCTEDLVVPLSQV